MRGSLVLTVRHGADHRGGQKQVGGVKWQNGVNRIFLKTCAAHYMLQMSLFEAC